MHTLSYKESSQIFNVLETKHVFKDIFECTQYIIIRYRKSYRIIDLHTVGVGIYGYQINIIFS